MEFAFHHSPWWLLLILPAAGALAWWMYRPTRDMLPQGVRWALGVFRFLILALIGILLLDPVLTSLRRIVRPPVVAVLQDVSESMVIHRDSAFVRTEYPPLLKSFVERLTQGETQADLYGFADQVYAGLTPDSLAYTGQTTQLSQALRDMRYRYQNQNLGAIVVVSDGIVNAGENPLYSLDQLRQPVYTVLLGDTTPQRDITIQDVQYNEIAYAGTETPILVKVRSTGFDPAGVKVSLSSGGRVLDTRDLSLARNSTGEVNLLIKPEGTGLQAYQLNVSRLDGEISYRNNTRTIYLNVLETRVKIALLAGSAHPDLGALRQAFDRTLGYELTEFVLKRPGEFAEDPARYDLAAFDLIILHNYPQSSADRTMVSKLADLIKNQNKPVMFLIGAFTDLRTLAPLYDYMALTPQTVTNNVEEAVPVFTSAYRNHATYTFPEDWIAWAAASPPLYRNQSNWQPRTNAEVYATARIKNINLTYPVFALQSFLGRKNMVLVGENFWRMRAHAFTEKEDFEYFDGWLFNNIRWLMANEDKRKFRVTTSRRLYTGSEPVIFKAQVYDDSYNPLPGVEIKVNVTGPGNQTREYFLNETAPARYELELPNQEEGTYSFVAIGTKNGVKAGDDRGQYSIGRSTIEHQRLQADQELLRQMALRSGGKFIYARDLPALADSLNALPGMKPVIEYPKKRSSLHDFIWVLIALLTLMSVEWIVRKVYSLI
ncbi:MAG: hypothetical protein SF053_14935 [Bacteroidia bacterium]|nr:hypothetical protein [Bacteroidia bacterium]